MNKFAFIICFMMLLKPVLPVFEYVCNYNYIVTELCENRDNVVMGCDGKCYLMKELAKASESEKPLSSDKKHVTAETSDLFVSNLEDYSFSVLPENPATMNSVYANHYVHLMGDSFFHPPAVIS